MEYKKILQEINNIVSDNVNMLAQLFPSAVKDGQVDFAALKEELGQFEEVGKEKYELTWSGKQNAKKLAQEGVYNRTLKYIEKDSKNPETTENLYIEGDNLEVLKLLRQNYFGAIKIIYIDPPYNTGKDFVYNDDFSMSKEESEIAEGIRTEDNERLQKNQQSSNKYHANWLNMMYPRLKIAKDLLTDDGVIFISIDDNEVDNLKKICNDAFGEHNFIGEIIRKTKSMTGDNGNGLNFQHENLLIFSKNKEKVLLIGEEKHFENYSNPDSDPLGDWCSGDPSAKSGGESTFFEIINPLTNKTDLPPQGRYWAFSKSSLEKYIKCGKIKFKENYKDNERGFIFKRYKIDATSLNNPLNSLFIENDYMNQNATIELKKLFDNDYFSYPKPIEFLYKIIKSSTKENEIILDYFSGSATTAHAIMQLNAEDGGNRKSIMVQLPEETAESSEAHKAGYKNICEIGKERMRRAGEKIKDEIEKANGQLKLGEEPKLVPDIGFKVFRTDDTNIKWSLSNTLGQIKLDDAAFSPDTIDFVMGANDIDVVYEIMLRQKDVALSERLEVLTDIGDRTYLYASSYLVCLETEITEEMIDKLAALEPLPIKFVFRDSAFGDDIDFKDYTFRKLGTLIEKNSGETKKTYTVEFI